VLVTAALTTACTSNATVGSDFCVRFEERWNAYAARTARDGAPGLSARKALLAFWHQAASDGALPDKIVDLLDTSALNLNRASDTEGPAQKTAARSLQNGFDMIASDCAKAGTGIELVPVDEAIG